MDSKAYKNFGIMLVCLSGIACETVEASQAPEDLGMVVVTEDKLVTPTKETGESVYTGSEVTKLGMETQDEKAAMSIYESVDILPGVSVESPDPFGLAAEAKNIRVRGVKGYLGAMTVEGVPNYGGNPMGPREYIYDTENIESIAMYKGAVPADLGTGVGARGGAIELRPLWPSDEFGAKLSQANGTDHYSRSFVRLDTGKIPKIDTKLSMSYSYSEADKWSGVGDIGPRNNLNLMLEQPARGQDKIRLWVNANDLTQNLYMPLSYNAARNTGKRHGLDFNKSLTGKRATDINYYDYNKGDYENNDVLAILPFTINDSLKLEFKPYYSKEDTEILQGAASQGGLIQKRLRDIERYGVSSEVQANFAKFGVPVNMSLGYWVESLDMSINTQNFLPGSMQFQGYGIYSQSDDNGIVHSPYLKLAGSARAFNWQAGLKYFYYEEPASKGFISKAPSYQLTHMADLDRDERTYSEWLPTLGLSYKISDTMSAHTAYGRNFIRPYAYVPIINLYNQNRTTKFQPAGITLNDLFEGYDMEISDTVEVGFKWMQAQFDIMPVLFASKHKNLLTTIHDPRVQLDYQQNVGDATGYGVEVETNVYLTEDLTLFFSPSYTVLTYDDDLGYQGKVLNCEGKQVVDTPVWMVKTGVIYKYGAFEAIPVINYIGDRYGDIEHREKTQDYMTVDLTLAYTLQNIWHAKKVRCSLDIINLLDKKYIAVINSFDDTRQGQATYYAGAPFSALFKVDVEF